jgi:hypothetical protein
MPTSQYIQQAEAILKAAQNGHLPEHVQASAHEGLAKTRQATRNSVATAREGAELVERVLSDTKTLAEKALQNFVANTEAAFDAAQAMLRARDVTEAAKLHAQFFQTQIAKAGEQRKEFYELASKLTQQTFATWNRVATKSFAQLASWTTSVASRIKNRSGDHGSALMKSETFTSSTEHEAAEALRHWLASHPLATIMSKIVSTLHGTASNPLPKASGERISVAIHIQYEEKPS